VIWYNDTEGNIGWSAEFPFTVRDTQAPTVVKQANQTTENPEYDKFNNISISVVEPDDASQVDKVWLNYTLDNWQTFTVVQCWNTINSIGG
jgi:hypothetical protein